MSDFIPLATAQSVETVTIVDETAPGGTVVINKSAFDPAVHTLAGAEAEGASKKKGAK